MHRNTKILVVLLAVAAVFIAGTNVRNGKNPDFHPQPTIPVTPTLTPLPTPLTRIYQNKECGVSFGYPSNLMASDTGSGSAALVSSDASAEMLVLACQKDIPRPAVPAAQMKTIKVGSISATLYRDTNAKDGTPVAVFIFRNPKNGKDIYFSSENETIFESVIQTLSVD